MGCTSFETALNAALDRAERLGRAGQPFPLVAGVTADMKPENAELLIRAFIRARLPAGEFPRDQIEGISATLCLMLERWQAGAKERGA